MFSDVSLAAVGISFLEGRNDSEYGTLTHMTHKRIVSVDPEFAVSTTPL